MKHKNFIILGVDISLENQHVTTMLLHASLIMN